MSLRLSLTIDGDATGARKAAADTVAAVKGVKASADDIVVPLDRARVATGALGAAHNGLSTQAMAAGHAMRSAAEGIAMGIPPSQILAQQFSHLSYAATGSGGISGAFKEAGAAISKFITPATLALGSLAAIGVGGYLLNQSLKETEKQFGALSERTGTAVQSLHAFESAAAFKGVDTADYLKGMERFADLTDQAEGKLGSMAVLFRANGIASGSMSENLLRAADLIRNASSEAEKYRLIQQLGLPPTRDWVRFLSQGSDELRKAAAGAVQFGGVADELMIRKANEFDDAWDKSWKNFTTASKRAVLAAKGVLEDLRRSADEKVADLTGNRMLDLRIINSDRALGDFSNRQLQGALDKRAAQLRNGGANTVDPEIQQKQLSFETQRIGALGQLATIQDVVRQSEIRIMQARLAGVSITAAEEARIRSYTEAQALGTLAIHQQADAARIEAGAVGLGVGAAAAFRAEQERLAYFRLRGIKLTDEQTAALHKEAQALGDATLATAQGRLRSDINFDRSQIGRSSEDQQIASRLRGSVYGDNIDMNGMEASAMKLNAQLQQTHDIGQDAFKGIIGDLRQGKSLSDAFGNAGLNALGKISDKLAEMAFNGIWNAAFGAKGGGGGFNLGSLFGAAGAPAGGAAVGVVGAAGPGFAVPTFGFAAGGWTGGAARHQVAGFVHGQEYVFDAAATAKIGVDNLEAIRRGVRGYADGGFVGAPPPAWPRSSANDNGDTSGGLTVNNIKVVNNHPDAQVQPGRAKRNSTGGIDLEIGVKQVVAGGFATGEFTDPINQRVAAPRRLTNR